MLRLPTRRWLPSRQPAGCPKRSHLAGSYRNNSLDHLLYYWSIPLRPARQRPITSRASSPSRCVGAIQYVHIHHKVANQASRISTTLLDFIRILCTVPCLVLVGTRVRCRQCPLSDAAESLATPRMRHTNCSKAQRLSTGHRPTREVRTRGQSDPLYWKHERKHESGIPLIRVSAGRSLSWRPDAVGDRACLTRAIGNVH